MIEVTLPDGSKREFDSPVTVGDVADLYRRRPGSRCFGR